MESTKSGRKTPRTVYGQFDFTGPGLKGFLPGSKDGRKKTAASSGSGSSPGRTLPRFLVGRPVRGLSTLLMLGKFLNGSLNLFLTTKATAPIISTKKKTTKDLTPPFYTTVTGTPKGKLPTPTCIWNRYYTATKIRSNNRPTRFHPPPLICFKRFWITANTIPTRRFNR